MIRAWAEYGQERAMERHPNIHYSVPYAVRTTFSTVPHPMSKADFGAVIGRRTQFTYAGRDACRLGRLVFEEVVVAEPDCWFLTTAVMQVLAAPMREVGALN